ncbi:hypothetical protein MFLO_03715 [Listeria floridensis FSL S10-1187]|uniref:VanZ-like domain-containing protein n=1 Tax=Listeria floridensis FSL S10-1187 TaxID=1265817 RepID=A0ABP3B278_9LIST|nr:VanZ family protein [Listeria floridensis]EUJ33219.1 hypothetical protein MFLO_03715 [Listeria floridensis FSL S10-1187]
MKKAFNLTLLPIASILFAIYLYMYFFKDWMYFYLTNLMQTYSFIDLLTISITTTLIYLIAIQVINRKFSPILTMAAYLIYFACLLFLLFGKGSQIQGISTDTFDFIDPFLAGNLRVITIGNVAAFIPIGFLFKKRGFFITLATAILLISSVEMLQYYLKVGYFDTGDIFLNVCGIILGYLAIRVVNAISKRNYPKPI